MSARGPVPKRSDRRRRNNPPAIPVANAPSRATVEHPPAHADWHPLARAWYESLAASGQSAFYEPSDWATAGLIAESMSRDLKPKIMGVDAEGEPVEYRGPMSGSSLASYLKGMSALLATEGDRRRALIELKRAGDGASGTVEGVPNIDDYRDRLSG